MQSFENYSLKKMNTFNVNVTAKRLFIINNEDEIRELIEKNKDSNDYLILGGGSNILFTKDFNGIVLKSQIYGINEIYKDKNFVNLEIGSGVIWDDLVSETVSKGYGGIENLSSIPGTVGAAPIQNIGAYGVELKEVFDHLEGVNLITGKKQIFYKDECEFGYRTSIFKTKMKNRFFITKVFLNLDRKPKLKISYRAIKEYIKEKKISNLNIQTVREIVIEIRKSKLPDPLILGNAGSFFKNPIIDKKLFLTLQSKFKDLVYFEIDKNQFKIPAGWLIEKAGLKGMRNGDVGVHKDQALVLVNYGNATGSEILLFSERIQKIIFDEFKIKLETEVNII